MIVRRWTFLVKSGKDAELRELLREGRKLFPAPHALRIYAPMVSEGGKMVVEYEFESMEEMISIGHQWWSNPETEDARKDWFGRIPSVTRAGGGSEIWGLVD
jgi:hypothetical protein